MYIYTYIYIYICPRTAAVTKKRVERHAELKPGAVKKKRIKKKSKLDRGGS